MDSMSTAHEGRATDACLRVFGDPAGEAIAIEPRGTVLGRATLPRTVDVAIADKRMSRQHARITRAHGRWQLSDLESANGTFVDGAPIPPRTPVDLADGSVLRFGDTVAVFTTSPPPVGADAEVAFYPGVSAAARETRARVRALADATGHVLVLGETGTGKERVARRLGQGKRFVPQNCAELSRELARSELFGHVKGAFSGATAAREGLVTAAGDGVLFLDELAELPLDVQGELLRFLEDGSYRALGAAELLFSPARVVAATNADLDQAVRAGTFRRDLLARLRASNAPIRLVPLRARREDIPGWTDLFLRELNPGAPGVGWTPGALECLLLHPWGDNLRELRGALREAVDGRTSGPLCSSALPSRIRDHRRALRNPLVGTAASPAAPARALTREELVAALAANGGNIVAAARALGIHRRALYRQCEKLEIVIDDYRSD